MDEIKVPSKILSEIVEHARQGYPEEVCGILAGKEQRVNTIYRMTNTEHSPVSYFMDPKEQFQVMKDMRQKDLQMLAIYHSHPDSVAYPSAKDVRLAFYDDVAYIIVSLAEEPPEVRAFEIKEGKVREIKLIEIKEQ
ncbi:MAG: M67 family metallopeptidase [Nitrospirae bacterium]|nr:M67 family metallopeptidase [Nitrospirota bacterium]